MDNETAIQIASRNILETIKMLDELNITELSNGEYLVFKSNVRKIDVLARELEKTRCWIHCYKTKNELDSK